jgi:hypothetical protein
MKPITFPEANKVLTKPRDWSDKECSSLPVYNDGEQSISLWKMTWRERLHSLFYGTIWLQVYSGSTSPPVTLSAEITVFINEKSK